MQIRLHSIGFVVEYDCSLNRTAVIRFVAVLRSLNTHIELLAVCSTWKRNEQVVVCTEPTQPYPNTQDDQKGQETISVLFVDHGQDARNHQRDDRYKYKPVFVQKCT